MALPVQPGWRKSLTPAYRHGLGDCGRWLAPAYRAQIAAEYAGGETSVVVAARHGVTRQTVLNCAVAAGVPIRAPGTGRSRETAHILTAQERIEQWTAGVVATGNALLDAKQAEIERRNREDAAHGGSAFRDGARAE